jgi:hypothetical protein
MILKVTPLAHEGRNDAMEYGVPVGKTMWILSTVFQGEQRSETASERASETGAWDGGEARSTDVRAQQTEVFAAARGYTGEKLDGYALRGLLADAHVQVDELVRLV